MTTIAYKGDILAADDLGQDGGGLRYQVSKIHVLNFMTSGPYVSKCRVCVASDGDRSDGLRLFRHLKIRLNNLSASAAACVIDDLDFDKELDIDPDDSKSSFIVSLAVVASGGMRHDLDVYRRVGRVMEPIGPRGYHAIGSGRDFALMAMRLGKTPKQAVELAHEFDAATGPDVQVVSLWPT